MMVGAHVHSQGKFKRGIYSISFLREIIKKTLQEMIHDILATLAFLSNFSKSIERDNRLQSPNQSLLVVIQ